MLEIGLVPIISLALLVIGVVSLWKKQKMKADDIERFVESDPTPDTVVLHQYGAAPYVPSISPYVMKLETYLRVANIPYVNKYDRKPGPKGKLPWIQYNKSVVPDSQFCIEFLNMEKSIDLNKKLSKSQLAIGHLARRTSEESLNWVLLTWRLQLDPNATIFHQLSLPQPIIWYLRHSSSSRLWSQGIGRHTEPEVNQIMMDDLGALSAILGEQKFLFGNTPECVTEFDCAVFGQLCQLVWQMPGCPVQDMIAENYPNLVHFCENMKEAFWPDWDERLLKTAEKTKQLFSQGQTKS